MCMLRSLALLCTNIYTDSIQCDTGNWGFFLDSYNACQPPSHNILATRVKTTTTGVEDGYQSRVTASATVRFTQR